MTPTSPPRRSRAQKTRRQKTESSHGVHVVVLLGGGIDSTVLLDMYNRAGSSITGLHYDYGQKALGGERRALRKIAAYFAVPVRWRKLAIPIASRGDEYLGRNAIFVLAAAAEVGNQTLRIGLGLHDLSPFYDCTRHFVNSMQSLLDGYFGGRVVLDAPLLAMTKAEIVTYARDRRVPLEATFSCNRGPIRPCGICPSCLDRRALGV